MFKRFRWLTGAACVLAGLGALMIPAAAGAAGSLPTLTVALHGTHGVSISGSTVSGAVNVVSTFSGRSPSGADTGPAFGLVRLDPGASIQRAAAAVQRHHGDINALTQYGTLFVSQTAPSAVQTMLTPGKYVALNISGNGQPGFAPFTVTQSSSPAPLPSAAATETAIEFGFRGPSVLHDGTIVRAVNAGWLAHMNELIRVPDAKAGRLVMTLLRRGKDNQAQKLLGRSAVYASLMGPGSPGEFQQEVLNTKPGYYVEACFMDNGDHREHTQDGMVRLIRVVK
jgi:hypothetical protein